MANEQNGQFNSALPMQNISEFVKARGFSTKKYESFFLDKINQDIETYSAAGFFHTEFYFHIPFCLKKCIFCPYTSIIPDKNGNKIEAYLSALIAEFNKYAQNINIKKLLINSIYFGGGTPSILSKEQLNQILKAIKGYPINYKKHFEFTFESLPSHITKTDFAENIINLLNKTFSSIKIRFSIGIQSFDTKVNKIINRHHSVDGAKYAIKILNSLSKKIKNLGFNVDLMIGLPEQTKKSILDDINFLISNRIPSISLEHTRILPNTILYKTQSRFKYLSQEEIIETKNKIYEILKAEGYSSLGKGNFITWSLPGYNRQYKAGLPFRLAFGNSAISDFPTFRYVNLDDINSYINTIKKQHFPHENVRLLTIDDQIFMAIREQLRMDGVINLAKIQNAFNYNFEDKHFKIIDYLLSCGFLFKTDNKLFLNKGYDMFDILKYFNC